MADLTATSPLTGVTLGAIGSVTLSEADLGQLTSLAAYNGQEKPLSDALKKAHGMATPTAGRATGKDGARAIWFAHNTMLLVGPAPDKALTKHAALTDQTDAWTALRLDGAGATEVLARLTPIDLRPTEFKRGHTARTQLQHMTVSITRLSDTGFLILGFRSMAGTLAHDLQGAMKGVAARRTG